jgi:hypothetical protein
MSNRTVEYLSDYIVAGVALSTGPFFHKIALIWNPDRPAAGGSLVIDPNSCGLDAFGDPTLCTKIAVSALDIRLTLLDEKPGVQAYTIEARPHGSTTEFSALPLRLVAIATLAKDQPRVRLLVIDAQQAIENIIDLNQAPAV